MKIVVINGTNHQGSTNGKVKPGFKTKAFFFIMHLLEKNDWNPKDVEYWKEKGWTGKKRPWNN